MRILRLLMVTMLLGGCSIERTVVNYAGDAIGGGGGVWMSDEDPVLIKEAIPFGLKTNESLLEISPDHVALLEATATGFMAYALLISEEADRLEEEDLKRARTLKTRASKLFIRGRDYALRGLELHHPGIRERLGPDSAAALAETGPEDVRWMYLAGVAWAGALSADTGNLGLVADLPTAAALVERVLELDDTYDEGSAHEFMVSYEASRPGGDIEVARAHYRRALELSGGQRASVHLALAESVSVGEQDVNEFRAMLAAARAVDLDEVPENRLLNVVAQQRADWLEERIPDLFLVSE